MVPHPWKKIELIPPASISVFLSSRRPCTAPLERAFPRFGPVFSLPCPHQQKLQVDCRVLGTGSGVENSLSWEFIQIWLVVEPTHLENISQNGNLPQVGVKIIKKWNHHLEIVRTKCSWLQKTPPTHTNRPIVDHRPMRRVSFHVTAGEAYEFRFFHQL